MYVRLQVVQVHLYFMQVASQVRHSIVSDLVHLQMAECTYKWMNQIDLLRKYLAVSQLSERDHFCRHLADLAQCLVFHL